MEKTLMGTQNEWDPFQKYPTNMLQLLIEYMEALSKGTSSSDIMALIEKHQDILNSGVGPNHLNDAAGMASNSTIYR